MPGRSVQQRKKKVLPKKKARSTVLSLPKSVQRLISYPVPPRFLGFWMSDKPLVQQALAAELSELILSIPHSTVASSSSSSSSSTSKKSSKRRKSEPEHSVSSTTTEVSISNRAKIGLAFVNGFWKAMIREWSMLDKYR